MEANEFMEKVVQNHKEFMELYGNGLVAQNPFGIHLEAGTYKKLFPEAPEGHTVKDQGTSIHVEKEVNGITFFCLPEPKEKRVIDFKWEREGQ